MMSTPDPFSLPALDILCFFGTFNPPHLGHTQALQSALRALPDLEKILVIPPAFHVWGKKPVSFDHRIQMARLAFEKLDSRVEVNDIEKTNNLSGYTVETLSLLQKDYRGKKIGILLGSDSMETFDTWKEFDGILKVASIFVAPRGKKKQHEVISILPEKLVLYLGRRIFFLPDQIENKALFTSSTAVRLEIPTHGVVELDPEVLSYITTHHLYTE